MELTIAEKDEHRFWSKVALPDANGCMLWRAHLHNYGYGRFSLGGRLVYAHRVSYQLANGALGLGLQVDHLCRVRHCVAPEHLEAVTQAENIRRGNSPTAANAKKTHCPQGHPYDGVNTSRRASGWRYCRTCNRSAQRRRSA